MEIAEIVRESVLALKVNKMRSALSILGIVIGIGSVISLISLGNASQISVRNRIESLGTNLLIIRGGSAQEGFLRTSSSNNSLKLTDVDAISATDRITSIGSVGADVTSRQQVSYQRSNTNVQITGVYGDYFNLRNITLSLGYPLTQENNTNFEKVAVIGPTIVEDLFGSVTNPIGEQIRINGAAYRVVGVTKSKGEGAGGSMDEVVYIPLLTMQKTLTGGNYVNTIYVGAKSDKQMDAALSQVGFYLLELHKKSSVALADFTISSQADLLETASSITQTFTTLLSGIAAISLLVGGIGIMNIMLVTVTERTSEIGLRKALGSKRKSVIYQFLIESLILTIIGGFIGMVLGVITSLVLSQIMSLPKAISIESIALAVVVSSVIGVLFGWYPAQKASKLTPIEALRYE